MFSESENIDFSPDVAPLRRTAWLIYGTVLAALLLLLGRNALVSTEGELAWSISNFAAGKMWYPDSAGAFFGGRLGGCLAGLTGSGEWTVRILSVMAALVLLAGTMRLAEMLFDRQVQAVAGWMLIGSYGFLYWGRHGSCFMLLAALLLWWAVLVMTPERRAVQVWALTALSSIGIAVFGFCFLLPAAALAVLGCRNSAPLSIVHRAVAVISAVLAVAVILILLGWDWDAGWTENLDAIGTVIWKSLVNSWRTMVYPGVGSADWYRTPLNLPRLLIPWLPVTVTVIVGMVIRWSEAPENLRKLLLSQAVMLVLTGLFPGKRWQYLLPMLPFFIVLTAGGLTGDCGVPKWNRIAELVMTWCCTLIAALAVATAVTYPLWNLLLKVYPPTVLIIGVPLLGLLAIGVLVFDTGPTCAVAKLSGMRGTWSGFILAAVALGIALWSVAVPSLTKFRTARPFWKRCHLELQHFPASAVIFFGDAPDDDELYYFNTPGKINIAITPQTLKKVLAAVETETAAVIVRQHRSAELLQIMTDNNWKCTGELKEGEPLRLLGTQSAGYKHYVMYEFTKLSPMKGK